MFKWLYKVWFSGFNSYIANKDTKFTCSDSGKEYIINKFTIVGYSKGLKQISMHGKIYNCESIDKRDLLFLDYYSRYFKANTDLTINGKSYKKGDIIILNKMESRLLDAEYFRNKCTFLR